MKIWMSRRRSALIVAIACARRFSAIGSCPNPPPPRASRPAPQGCCAENGDDPERGKDRGENSVINTSGEGSAE
jgi:hypothetical protein